MSYRGARRATRSRRARPARGWWRVGSTALIALVVAVTLTFAVAGHHPRIRHRAVAVPVAPNATAAAGAKKPNIVMIVADDMRADELSYMPHVQQLLVDRGTDFTNALSPHPLCCPARAEMFTGQYAQNNGVHHNAGPWGAWRSLHHPNDNLGAWMQKAGYWTGFVGKWLNDYKGQVRIKGWDRWKPATGYVYDYHRVRYYHGRVVDGYVAETTTRFTDSALRTGHRSGKPFYVVSNFLAPHDTVDGNGPSLPVPEPKYAHACDGIEPAFVRNPAYMTAVKGGLPSGMTATHKASSGYVAESHTRICALRSVDDGVAKIVRTLKRTGEYADTDIVFVSDNGFDLGDHWLFGKNFLTAESLDVPIVAAGPDFPVGHRSGLPVSLVDLPATYLQLSGAKPGRPQDGESLLRLLDASGPRRDTLLVQTGDDVADSTPGFAYRGVRTQRYLYGIDPSHPSVGLLFDHRRDPHALVNVFDDPRYAAVHAALQRRLEALMPCAGATCNQVFGPLPRPKR